MLYLGIVDSELHGARIEERRERSFSYRYCIILIYCMNFTDKASSDMQWAGTCSRVVSASRICGKNSPCLISLSYGDECTKRTWAISVPRSLVEASNQSHWRLEFSSKTHILFSLHSASRSSFEVPPLTDLEILVR